MQGQCSHIMSGAWHVVGGSTHQTPRTHLLQAQPAPPGWPLRSASRPLRVCPGSAPSSRPDQGPGRAWSGAACALPAHILSTPLLLRQAGARRLMLCFLRCFWAGLRQDGWVGTAGTKAKAGVQPVLCLLRASSAPCPPSSCRRRPANRACACRRAIRSKSTPWMEWTRGTSQPTSMAHKVLSAPRGTRPCAAASRAGRWWAAHRLPVTRRAVMAMRSSQWRPALDAVRWEGVCGECCRPP